ncbi:hypothetical protein [Nonomuraea sp. NPDC049725]|uniref:hypothetical protein n=1 Tax=Nonomuraea sp. NPDC049725 TaxID=3154508 RepID=UPI00342B8811
MEVESSICLSDLVPALRWSRPQQVAEALADPRLPAAWWSSQALTRALGTAGLDWICDRLALLASSRWDYLPLGDLLPALTLHPVDPGLSGWPEPARTAIAGLGGWHRLRRLSPADLKTPSATPEAVMGTVFREVLGHLAAQPESAARAVQSPEITRPVQQRRDATGPHPVTGPQPAVGPHPATGPQPAVGPAPGTPGGSVPSGPVPGGLVPGSPVPGGPVPGGPVPGPYPGQRPSGPPPAQTPAPLAAQGEAAPQGGAAYPGGPSAPGFPPGGGPTGTGPFPAPAAPGSVPPGATFPPDGGSSDRDTGSFPATSGNAPAGPGSGPFPAVGGDQFPGSPTSGPFPAAGPTQPGAPGSGAPQPGNPGPPQAGGPAQPGTPLPGSPAFPGGPGTGSFPAVGESAPQRGTGSFPAVNENGTPLPQRPTASRPPQGPPAAPGAPRPTPALSDTDHAMVRVVDGLFRGLNKLELAVAVHRLFAEDPVSLRTLAHKMLVEREVLSQAQRTAEERVLHWLRSSESAPVTGHMFRLTEWLGAAATQDQLIGADPAHPVTVPSLRTPLWRVLVTLMPDRRLQDGWLVVGDIHGLQARTRQLLASAPPDADPVELLAELGIRTHSAKAWLDALPSESADPVAAASAPAQPLPRRTPGANGHHHRGGQPIPPAPAGSIDPSAALATLSALSGGRSPVLPGGGLAGAPSTPPPPLPSPSSDPRRWQRIEVTPEHLRGGPVPVPEGYAAQLGMRPGTLLSVTGPGDNAIVLVWQGHQPVFDSLQPVLMRLNARPGDQVYVTVDGYRLEAQLTG